MNDKQKTDQINKLIEAKIAELSEYCDALQIMATWSSQEDPNNTYSTSKGFGNWYARVGLVHKFCEEERARTQAQVWEDSDECND
jgi:hypothetical protein